MGYVVAAGYVTVETAVPGGRAKVDVPRGAALPDDVPAEQIDHLLRIGDIQQQQDAATTGRPTPPPKRGPGSGLDAWTAYANGWGVTVPEGWGRDLLIDELSIAGIPVD